MPADTTTLIGLAVAAIVVLWLVFSVFKKLIGILFLVGIAAGAYYLWTNPEALRSLTAIVGDLIGG